MIKRTQFPSQVNTVKKIFKWLTTSLLTVVTLFALGVIYITVAIDPNHYKSNIETIAAQSGVELSLDGDVGWQFFPLGLRLNQVNFNLSDQSLVGRIEQLSLAIDWGALIRASQDNAQMPISGLSIEGGQLFLSRPNQLPVQISAINLTLTDIALDGTAFPVSLSLKAPGGIPFSLDTELGIVYTEQKISDFALSDFKLSLGDLKLTGALDSSDQMTYILGNIETQNFDLLKQMAMLKLLLPDLYVPEMADPKALSSVSLSGNFSLEPTQTSEIQAQLVVDDQPVIINILLDEQRYKMTTMLSVDSFKVSSYLLKNASENSNAALFAPLAIPLALWHGKSQVEVHVGQLELEHFSLANIYLNLFGNRNVFKMNSFAADAFEGQINAVAQLDLRSSVANFDLQSSMRDLNLDSMVAATSIDSDPLMEGILNLEFDLQGSGNHTETVINSLSGGGQLSVLSPVYKSVNLEQTLCSAAAMLSSSKQTNQLDSKDTELNDLTANFRLDKGQLIIADYQTGTGNISLSGKGSLDLLDQTYGVKNEVLVTQSKTSAQGCSINKRLQNRKIPFRCDGKLGDTVSCKPDASLIKLFLPGARLDSLGDKVSKSLGLDGQGNPLKRLIEKRLKSRQ